MQKNLFSALLFLLLINPTSSFAQGFDEIFSAPGTPRPHYKEIWNTYSKFDEEKRKDFLVKSKKDFRGDNALLPIPRIYTYDEITLLRKGVDQRGRALRAFLKDHYSGEKEYLKAKLIPQLVIDRIVDRSFEKDAEQYLKTAKFNFWYGPDIIKDATGTFRVVEDNTGFIGGMGDLRVAREILNKRASEYQAQIDPTNDPDVFYEQITSKYKETAKHYGGIPLLVTYANEVSSDKEDTRVRKIFKDYGIESVTLNPYKQNKKKTLVSRPDGLYFLKTDKDGTVIKEEKVGYVVLNVEAYDIEPFHPTTKSKFIHGITDWILNREDISASKRKKMQGFDEAQWVKWLSENENKIGYPINETIGVKGFWDHIINEKAGCTNIVGTEFVNDKLFYVYVEKLVKFYLKEEPILKNIETESAATFLPDGSVTLNEEVLLKVKKNIQNYVGKGAAGRGGDQIYIGKKATPEKMDELFAGVRLNPAYYIFQAYTDLSVMNGYIIDQRVLSDISDRNSISWVPWGRATPITGNGLVNISDQGLELAAIVHNTDKIKPCNLLLQ